MKINITVGSDNNLSGYINVDPVASEGKTVLAPHNLDEICEAGQCVELIAEDILDYYSSREVDNVIEHWVSKIRHSGTLVVGGLDLNKISKAVLNKDLDLLSVNVLLFGDQSQPWQFRKSILTAPDLVHVLQSHGLEILKTRYTQDYKYVVVSQRP